MPGVAAEVKSGVKSRSLLGRSPDLILRRKRGKQTVWKKRISRLPHLVGREESTGRDLPVGLRPQVGRLTSFIPLSAK